MADYPFDRGLIIRANGDPVEAGFVATFHETPDGPAVPTKAMDLSTGHTITTNSHLWVFERPATTVVGQFRPGVIAAPGFRKDVSRQNAAGSVRVTVQDAATLQGFRTDYPWQGPNTKQHEQVGNAVPPPLAAHVLAVAIGMTAPKERAA